MSSKYMDMSVLEALRRASDKSLMLPDIQREYVWDPSDIESLFESIVEGYPIGSCIFWKTNKETINKDEPNLYHFFSKFVRGVTKNEKESLPLGEDREYYIVLDGQQRITSLNIALKGSYKYFKGGRGHSWTNRKSWVEKELYYDLDFHSRSEAEEDDEHPKKRFVFLTTDEAKAGHYYKVKNVLGKDKLIDYLDELADLGITDKKCRSDLSVIHERIHSSSNDALIHYYCIDEESYDKALNIFVRVNSTGKKLSKSDLLFSTLIDGWKDGKENVDGLIDSMNGKGDGFAFSRDYLMRACLVLTGANPNLKIESLNRATISAIRNDWQNIDKCFDRLSDLLVEIGMSNETMSSYNATMPIAYYLYRGGDIKGNDQKQELRKFLSVSFAKRLFGVASNAALSSTRTVLSKIDCGKTPFSLSLFDAVSLVGGRTFHVDESEIDRWLDTYEKGQSTYILLTLLYPNLKFSQVAFHQDHCHPYAGFEARSISSLGIDKDTAAKWRHMRNLLPNLQFLEEKENESKNKDSLKQWVSEGNDFAYHPSGISLELSDFEAFFAARRKLMKDELMKLFGVDSNRAIAIDPNPATSLNDETDQAH